MNEINIRQVNIKQKLQFYEKENKLYMPNEIFTDLRVMHDKGSSHVAFAYSYYYLVSWLYRYAKYGQFDVDVKMVKELLGYHAAYQGLDYVMKKNGILDEMGYTITTKDYPTAWTFDDGWLDFHMLSDLDDDTQKMVKESKSRKYTIKYPVKAFYRDQESESENYMNGTFYEIENTHLVPFDVFVYCMDKSDMGTVGFYLWSYLKMKCQQFTNGYDVGVEQLSQETMIARSTMINYLNVMRQYRMINVYYNQEFFCVALKDDERQANTYKVNEYDKFTDKPVGYSKMKFISPKSYHRLKDESEDVKDEIGKLLW